LEQECVLTAVAASVEPIIDMITDTGMATTMDSQNPFASVSSHDKSVLPPFKTMNTVKDKKRKENDFPNSNETSDGHDVKQLASSEDDVSRDQNNVHQVELTKIVYRDELCTDFARSGPTVKHHSAYWHSHLHPLEKAIEESNFEGFLKYAEAIPHFKKFTTNLTTLIDSDRSLNTAKLDDDEDLAKLMHEALLQKEKQQEEVRQEEVLKLMHEALLLQKIKRQEELCQEKLLQEDLRQEELLLEELRQEELRLEELRLEQLLQEDLLQALQEKGLEALQEEDVLKMLSTNERMIYNSLRQEVGHLYLTSITHAKNATLINEKKAVINEKKAVIKGKKDVIKEKSALIKEKKAVIKEKSAVIKEKNAVIKGKKDLIKEKEASIKDKQASIKAESEALIKDST